MLWALATAGVIVAIACTSVATSVYRMDASDRARADDHAQAAATALLGSIQQEMNHRLAWELSGGARDAGALSADRTATRQGIARFSQATRDANAAGASTGDARSLAAAIQRWEASTAAADRPTPARPTGIDRRGAALERRLAATANTMVYGVSRKQRSRILALGLEVTEMRPLPAPSSTIGPAAPSQIRT
jgi:hypothetical protein